MEVPGASPPRACILFALSEEMGPFLQRADFPRPPHPFPRGRWERVCSARLGDIAFAWSGAGARTAGELAQQMFREYGRPPCLLVCGFAGGLASQMPPGSLILADTLQDQAENTSYVADSALLAIAESVRLSGVPLQRGPLVTSQNILIHPRQKHALAAQTGALAVDMETAGAARVAQQLGVPWIAVRAITDSANDAMPLDFNALADAEGNVDRPRVVRTVLTRPWKIPALIRLGVRSARAARNLAAFVEAFLQSLPEKAP